MIQIVPLEGIGAITERSDLAAELLAAMARGPGPLQDGDIVVVAQKIVSKAEGRLRALADFTPSPRALELAAVVGKDARYVEAVLSESRSVLRAVPNVLIVEHRLGHIMANAGIDQSNVDGGDDKVLLLPLDPDRSAAALRLRLSPGGAPRIGVVISDSFGRPWRMGTTCVAIGVCGPAAVIDRRGETDMFGRTLVATEIAFADTLAAAAGLAMGETDERIPAALLRGLAWTPSDQHATDVLRAPSGDLFR